MFGLSEFALGAIAGGATIFLSPGRGAAGNVWFKGVRALVKAQFKKD